MPLRESHDIIAQVHKSIAGGTAHLISPILPYTMQDGG